jgi:type II secretory pathway component GspD/PulD (secretin)
MVSNDNGEEYRIEVFGATGEVHGKEANGIRRVPILGRIPVANPAFRKKDKKRESTELIAFITPTVLRDPESDAEATEDAAQHVELINEWRPLDEEKPEEVKERKPWWRRNTGGTEK